MKAPFDEDVLTACVDLVGRTGAKDFAVGYLSDEPPYDWYAEATFHGAKLFVGQMPGPEQAADGLARRLLAGARCLYCGKTVTLDEAGEGCRWVREGPKWTATCQKSTHTSVVLARALAQIPGMPQIMITRALAGDFHDYLSESATPEIDLYNSLLELARHPATPRDSRPLMRAMAKRVMIGDFDASKEEGDEWTASPQGQATLAELGPLLREALGELHDATPEQIERLREAFGEHFGKPPP